MFFKFPQSDLGYLSPLGNIPVSTSACHTVSSNCELEKPAPRDVILKAFREFREGKLEDK